MRRLYVFTCVLGLVVFLSWGISSSWANHCDPEYNNDIAPDLAGQPNGLIQTVSRDCSGTPGCDEYFDIVCSGQGDTLFLTFCSDGGTADFDTGFSVWDNGPAFNSNEACQDDFCGLQSQLSFVTTPGVTYRVRIGGFGSASGTYTLAYSAPSSCMILGAGNVCAATVVKSALPPDDTEFNFFVDTGEDFSLSDPSNTTEIIMFDEGETITVTEEVPLGWELTNVDCGTTNGTIITSPVQDGVELECLSGSQATCIFSNQIAPRPIPTLSEWGLIAMAGVLGIIGLLVMRRRKYAS